MIRFPKRKTFLEVVLFVFLFIPLVLYASDEPEFSGDLYQVKGIVRWYGKMPPKKELSKISYNGLCGKKPKELIEFSHKRIKDVVVWLDSSGEGDSPPRLLGARPWEGGKNGEGTYEPAGFAGGSIVIVESGCEFQPRVSAVPLGTKIEIVNADRKDHWLVVRGRHVKKADKIEEYGRGSPEFTLKTPHVVKVPSGEKYGIYASAPDVIFLQSGFHHWMRAFVVVLNTGHMAVTNSRGEFVLSRVQPGKYYLHAWHPILGDSVKKVSIPEDIRRAAKIVVSYSKLPADGHGRRLESTVPSIEREVRETYIDEIDP